MDRTIKTELCNMCMIYDENTGCVLVQDKIAKESNAWSGYTFPGGHVENGESIHESVIREVREETGLEVKETALCGVVDWFKNDTPERYLVFLYKTKVYSGMMIDHTKEGRVFWMPLEEFKQSRLAPNMEQYLEVFLKDSANEGYGEWNDTTSGALTIL